MNEKMGQPSVILSHHCSTGEATKPKTTKPGHSDISLGLAKKRLRIGVRLELGIRIE